MKYILSIFLVLTCAATAMAQDLKPYFAEVAQHWQVSQTWIEAISEVESGLRPWALNIAGKSFYFETKDEAVAAAEAALVSGKSFDTGIMQINNFWLKKYDIDLATAFEPLANIYLGGFVLRQEIERLGHNAKAIGAYHSPNPDKARLYANKVLAAIENNNTKPLAVKPSERSHQTASLPISRQKEKTLAAMAVRGNNNTMKVVNRR